MGPCMNFKREVSLTAHEKVLLGVYLPSHSAFGPQNGKAFQDPPPDVLGMLGHRPLRDIRHVVTFQHEPMAWPAAVVVQCCFDIIEL
jgi:hypothetical protein